MLGSLLNANKMNSPFTREEQAFARDIKRLANGIEKLVELLEKSNIVNNQQL